MFAPVVILFFSFAAIEATPVPLLDSASGLINYGLATKEVSNCVQAVAVIVLIALQQLVLPVALFVLRPLLLPVKIIRAVVRLPLTIAYFIITLPKRILLLPFRIVTLPHRIVSRIVNGIKGLFSPVVRVINFIVKVIGFWLGQPTRVFNNVFVYP